MEEPDDQANFSKGSQECTETVCDQCSESDDLLIKADGYCITCKAYICKTCIQSHKRIKMLRDHQIQGPTEMPKTKPSQDTKYDVLPSQEILTIECKQHVGEVIKYFCKSHNVVGCMHCITLAHRSCDDIMRVVDASTTTSVKTELEVFDQRLKTVAEGIQNLLQMAEENHLQVEDQREQLLQDVRKFKETVFELLNKMVSEIETQVQDTIREDQAKNDQLVKRCLTLQEDIKQTSNEFDSLRRNNQKTKEFIIMNQSAMQLEKWENDRKDMAANAKPVLYEFCPDVNFRQIMGKVSNAGQIVVKTDAEQCDVCKLMSIKIYMQKVSCGHHICDSCTDGSDENERACSLCGKVTVTCKTCKTAVDKSSISTLACGHNVCLPCRKLQTKNETPCTDCGLITGNQPKGSLHDRRETEGVCHVRVLEFSFSDGKQESYHPCPGKAYNGDSLTCRLSTDENGQRVYKMLKTAFDHKLICRIEQGKIVSNIEMYQGQVMGTRTLEVLEVDQDLEVNDNLEVFEVNENNENDQDLVVLVVLEVNENDQDLVVLVVNENDQDDQDYQDNENYQDYDSAPIYESGYTDSYASYICRVNDRLQKLGIKA